jgi:hypothetical protein
MALAGRARQRARLQRAGRRLEVDRRHYPAAEYLRADFHGNAEEIPAEKPPAVRDQQLNSCLRAQQALCPYPQRCREVIEARSKSGIPSDLWITRSC